LAIIVAIALALSISTPAQTVETPDSQLGQIMGTVTDVNGDPVIGATVVLKGPDPNDRRSIVAPENGFFQFEDVKPGVKYEIDISAAGFADWTSPIVALAPGQFDLLGGIELRLAAQLTTVRVVYNPVEIATEQINAEEKQRVLGIVPNFYVSYEGDDAAPLTTKMKFQLALKVSYDPVTIGGVALMAGIRQATDSPNYPQGAKGYGERFGATAADGFTDIMIGGAILPSLLHQDPRYFYQGTGSTRSRLRHAILSPFICKGDNGKWQPNYSSVGGDLASSALSNLYFPKSNRGAGLVFSQFAIGTAERVVASVAQEFVLSRLTHRGGHTD
jgi:Carboxypeptidase regulatory-like domain